MKALVVGYGSIGRRHADLLVQLGLEVAVVSRRDIDGVKRFSSLVTGLSEWRPDYVVIASNTSEHKADLEILAAGKFQGLLLIEKPLMNEGDVPPAGLPEKSYIAYNLRFHPAVKAMRDALADTNAYALHAYVGQYLPDWRPDTDYRDSYSAKSDLGGGVLRDLSHELDLINWLFGPWRNLTAVGGKFSRLDIDSDDVFSILLALDKCPVASVSMNYLDDRATRYMTVHTEKGTFRLDLIAGTFEANGGRSDYSVSRDDTYLEEHKAVLNGRTESLCGLNDGIAAMQIILAAEKAASHKTWISN